MEVSVGMVDGTGHIQSYPECLALRTTLQTRAQPSSATWRKGEQLGGKGGTTWRETWGKLYDYLNSKSNMLLSLNNIAHHIKHSDSPHLANSSSYGALDLSNDEAQHPSQVG